ncbi:MAG: flagellar basal body rod protein FlgC [Planctomycetes bacterium]|nr:flagellar basal body rod protein FlgC [Planctomycetota bacterium]
MLRAIDISTSALIAQRQRMNTIAGNIANANTTRNEQGESVPFQRRMVTFAANESLSGTSTEGVGVNYQVEIDMGRPARPVYEPGHPDANADGIVLYPDIETIQEFANAMDASRAYEANVAVIEISKEMANLGLRILA